MIYFGKEFKVKQYSVAEGSSLRSEPPYGMLKKWSWSAEACFCGFKA